MEIAINLPSVNEFLNSFLLLVYFFSHRLLTSQTGRALAIQPEGIFDLKDDFEHGWAGDQLRPIIQRRRDAGFNA